MSYPPPPAAAAPAPSGRQRLRGRIPLRLALIFGILGIAGVVVGAIVVKSMFSTVDGFKRVSLAAGQGTVTLDAGSYVGYYEQPAASGSVTVQLAITDPQGGNAVKVSLYGKNASSSSTLTYDRNGKHGEALYKFTIDHRGSYAVQVATQGAAAPAGADIALGKSIAGKLVTAAVLIIAGVLLLVAAIILLIIGLVKRSRHKKQLATAGSYGYPPPPGYGPPAGYGPPQGYAPPQQGWQQPPPPGPPNP